MFKLQKHKSSIKSRDSFDFKFSDFHAVKVPKGWDKLFVCLVSVETGKTVVKSAKASVRHGACRWTDNFSESLHVSPHNASPSLYKLVVAMGSSRSGVLGEVVVDLADYMTSSTSTPLSLPLKKCNYDTSIQFNIQCLTPKAKYRDAQSNETSVNVDYVNSDHDDIETKSDASDGTFSRSVGSTSSSHFESASPSQAVLSRDPSLSASESRHSIDSIEASLGKETFSENHPISAVNIGRQDSIESNNGGPSRSVRAVNNGSQSNNASFSSRVPGSLSPYRHKKEWSSGAFASSAFSNTGSSKDLLEAAEVTIEELRAEARMWERNSKKLTVEVDVLKNEVSEQSRSQTNVNMELSASQQECNGLKQENEHLKSLIEEAAKKGEATEDLRIQAKDMDELQKEMEEEIRFLKDSNDNLNEQLQRTQESNIELLSILQELEGIVETQKKEIENLSSLKPKVEEREILGSSKDMESHDSILKGSEVVAPTLHPGEQSPVIDNIKLQLQQLQETQEELEAAILLLENTVEEKDSEIEREQGLRVQALLDCESNWMLKIAAKEEEIKNLEAKLDEAVKNSQSKEFVVDTGGKAPLIKEIEFLRRKVEDLEKDCQELTEENMELLLKLKESRENLSPDAVVSASYIGPDGDSLCKCGTEISHLRVQLQELQDELQRNEVLIEESAQSAQSLVQCPDLENKCSELEKKVVCLEGQLQKFHAQVKEQQVEIYALKEQLKQCEADEPKSGDQPLAVAKCLEGDGEEHKLELGNLNKLSNPSSSEGPEDSRKIIYSDASKEVDVRASELNLLKEEEIEALQGKLSSLEDQIGTVHNEKRLLEETIESLEREKAMSSESVEELKKEIMMLSCSLESHVSASKVLERLSSELGKGKQDVEQQLSELEGENMQLSERISALEAQLRYLTNEKETCQLELRHSKAQSTSLHDEIKRLKAEMEAQKVDMKHKLQDMKTRWVEAQEECEYLKKANPKLQSTAESLIEECDSLQKYNGEVKRQNMELHTRCTLLESQLRDSQWRFAECSKKVEALEAEFSNILEEVSLKEKSLNSELESLIIDDKEHKEKLMQENISLTDAYSQKVVEVENLQRELIHLIDQISVAHDEKETMTSEAILELTVLRADKAKLELAFRDLLEKFTLYQRKLSIIESECEDKLHELTASRKREEHLMADRDRLSVLLESVKSDDEKNKSIISELEINLKASEYERRQLAQEILTLKEQMKRAMMLQDECVSLKTTLNEAKFDYEREKASLDLLHGEYEELKTEKDSLLLKISSLEKALSELEDCQRGKVALQEKVLRLEGDLSAREALCAQDAELKFELSRIKRANGELQRKIKLLEQDHEGYLKRIESLEEQLKQKIQTTQNLMQSAGVLSDLDDAILAKITGSEETDYLLKIQYLENELAEALEANDMYKTQLRRFMPEEENKCDDMPETGDNRSDFKMNGSNITALEVELKELRERYFQMSLKYAEVEAQREDLVLKLKSNNTKRRWFS